MNTIIKYTLVASIWIALNAFSVSRPQSIAGEWQLVMIDDEDAQAINGSLVLQSNGRFSQTLADHTRTGTWQMSADNTTLILHPQEESEEICKILELTAQHLKIDDQHKTLHYKRLK